MHLEIISREALPFDSPPPVESRAPRGTGLRRDLEAEPRSLLFVHGAYCGAWIWDEHFLSYFAERGYSAHAVSLRGHGGSDGYLPRARLADYVADLARAVDQLATRPVLIGHSLGGVVVQRYLQRERAPGAVLLASGPPHGMLLASWTMALRHPLLATKLWTAHVMGLDRREIPDLRRVAFGQALPQRSAEELLGRMGDESWLAALEVLWPFNASLAGDTPLLVLGAEEDFFVPPWLVRATAEAYRREAEIFPQMGHAMMVDSDWQLVADRILRWLAAV